MIDAIKKKIDDSILESVKKEPPRGYMGASGIGEACDRKLWYSFKQPKKILNPRVQRIFRIGDAYETYIVKLLRDAGFTVYDEDDNGDQFGFVDGKIAGHCDGAIMGLPHSPNDPHLLEIKSAKNTSFNKYKKNGVKKESSTYFIQMQTYMNKLGLSKALFVMMNKDNQELYIEIVEFDKVASEMALLRAKDISETDELPSRKYAKSTFFKCKWCDWREECWE